MTKHEFDLLNEELHNSSKTIKEFMSDHSLPVHRYYYWKKRFYPAENKALNNFIQIGNDHPLHSNIRLEYPNGVVLNIQSYPGTKSLLKLINNKY